MKTGNKILLSSALALAVAGISSAEAQDKKMVKEKCYGVVKAKQNDCKTANSSCAGSSEIEGDKTAFVVMPQGLCEKLIGGSLEPGENEKAPEAAS